MYREEFEQIGKKIIGDRLLTGNFGNLSVRSGDGFYITASGAFLDDPGQLVYVPLKGEVPSNASSEYQVHRAVYLATPAQALVHAHPPVAVGASLYCDVIEPIDSEGIMVLPEIPVVDGAPGSEELAEEVASGLRKAPLVLARGHGTFAIGDTPEEGYLKTAVAEHACSVLWYASGFARALKP